MLKYTTFYWLYSIDSVCRKASSRSEHIYFYKNKAPVFILGMVDDILGVSKCGSKSDIYNYRPILFLPTLS